MIDGFTDRMWLFVTNPRFVVEQAKTLPKRNANELLFPATVVCFGFLAVSFALQFVLSNYAPNMPVTVAMLLKVVILAWMGYLAFMVICLIRIGKAVWFAPKSSE